MNLVFIISILSEPYTSSGDLLPVIITIGVFFNLIGFSPLIGNYSNPSHIFSNLVNFNE